MIRQMLSFALVLALLFPSLGTASFQNSPKQAGRLGAAAAQGFKIQVAQKDKVQDLTIATPKGVAGLRSFRAHRKQVLSGFGVGSFRPELWGILNRY